MCGEIRALPPCGRLALYRSNSCSDSSQRGEHHGEAQGSYAVIKEVLAFIVLVSRPHPGAFSRALPWASEPRTKVAIMVGYRVISVLRRQFVDACFCTLSSESILWFVVLASVSQTLAIIFFPPRIITVSLNRQVVQHRNNGQ